MDTPLKIFVGNLGYARDIDGSALRHVLRSWRQFYTPHHMQKRALDACIAIIRETDPDICCFIEVDSGSPTSGGFDQFTYLHLPEYPHRNIISKYVSPRLQNGLLTRGKSNAFMAKQPHAFQRLFLSRGSKRLIYRIDLSDECVLFFTHLSLNAPVRQSQLEELRGLADAESRHVLIAGDFNILAGLDELHILTGDDKYLLANDPDCSTFRLMNRRYLLDVCVVSAALKPRVKVDVIDQPYSDHDALLIHIAPKTA